MFQRKIYNKFCGGDLNEEIFDADYYVGNI